MCSAVHFDLCLASFSKIVRYQIIHPRHGTEECNICSKHKAALKLWKQKGDRHKIRFSAYLIIIFFNKILAEDEETAFGEHIRANADIRSSYHNLVDNLPQKQAVVVGDFKENVKLPWRLRQRDSEFYENQQVSVLTFVVFANATGKTRKVVVTFVSKVLNHDALFLRDCYFKLSTLELLRVCRFFFFFTFFLMILPKAFISSQIMDNHFEMQV
jgi:hypothetical protein